MSNVSDGQCLTFLMDNV